MASTPPGTCRKGAALFLQRLIECNLDSELCLFFCFLYPQTIVVRDGMYARLSLMAN